MTSQFSAEENNEEDGDLGNMNNIPKTEVKELRLLILKSNIYYGRRTMITIFKLVISCSKEKEKQVFSMYVYNRKQQVNLQQEILVAL